MSWWNGCRPRNGTKVELRVSGSYLSVHAWGEELGRHPLLDRRPPPGSQLGRVDDPALPVEVSVPPLEEQARPCGSAVGGHGDPAVPSRLARPRAGARGSRLLGPAGADAILQRDPRAAPVPSRHAILEHMHDPPESGVGGVWQGDGCHHATRPATRDPVPHAPARVRRTKDRGRLRGRRWPGPRRRRATVYRHGRAPARRRG